MPGQSQGGLKQAINFQFYLEKSRVRVRVKLIHSKILWAGTYKGD